MSFAPVSYCCKVRKFTPVPFRGQTNTPVLVEYCYNFVASARNVTPSELSTIVDNNIRKLFGC